MNDTARLPACLLHDCERTAQSVELGNAGTAAAFSSRSPDKPTPNEDAALVMPIDDERCVLAVADGLGGLPAGAHASRATLEALRDAICETLAADEALREGILSGFDRANKAVLARGDGSASTLIVAEIERGRLRTYHVGDSAALVCGGMGKLKLQTIAHSPVGYAVEAGVLDESDAMNHEDRHLISNVIGDSSMHVAVGSPLSLRPRDTLVVASDGLFDNLYAGEIIELLRSGPLAQGIDRLADECGVRMESAADSRPHKPDDLTIIAYRRASTR